jgi:hypothetical protein
VEAVEIVHHACVAKPSAVCLSENDFRQVKSRLDLKVSDLDATQLKIIRLWVTFS